MSTIKDKDGFEYILLKKDTFTMMVLNETAKHIDWSLSEQDIRVIKGQTFING
ncbi:MAG: hypothetical protein NTU73_06270 [Ignavibacteriae bacterium]|nr:hypothetical protein [Ignavibacteriota bacterium]